MRGFRSFRLCLISPYSGENWSWKFSESSAKPYTIFFFFSWKKGADKLTEVGEEGWGLAWPVPHDEAGGPFASLSLCLSSIKYQALQSCDHAMAPKIPGDLSKGLFRDEKPWFLGKTVPVD